MNDSVQRFRQMAWAIAVALVLLGSHATHADAPAAPVPITIIRSQFNPAAVTIAQGQTITWTNDDDSDHTVVAVDGSFASGTLKHGDTFSHQFPTPGNFLYGDRLHPRMKGSVVVK